MLLLWVWYSEDTFIRGEAGGPSNITIETVRSFPMMTVEVWVIGGAPIRCPLESLRNVCKRLFGWYRNSGRRYQKNIVLQLTVTLMLGKIEGKRKGGRQRVRWLDGITDSMDTV